MTTASILKESNASLSSTNVSTEGMRENIRFGITQMTRIVIFSKLFLLNNKLLIITILEATFHGGVNSVWMKREYYLDYGCQFILHLYPFDTQVS